MDNLDPSFVLWLWWLRLLQTYEDIGGPLKKLLVTHSCPSLCNTMGLPGSSFSAILQERIMEGVAIPLSKGSSQPRDQLGSPALQVDSLSSEKLVVP